MKNQRRNPLFQVPKQRIAYVPTIITIIILSKLPVTSLLRFKCVCKQWHSWISNPKFELSNQQRGRVFVLSKRKDGSTFRIINQQQYFKSKISKLRYNVLGSCDGLLLINVNKHIFLWNPATRFCNKVLEHSILAGDDLWYITGGFCFDPVKNDYKVLLFTRPEFLGYGCETAIIASLKDKKWRGIHCPYDILSLCVPDWITIHGRLHSRVRVKIINGIQCCGPHNSLIYFDVVSEKFHMLPIPDTISEKIDQFQIPKLENAIVGLGVLNGCLSMTYLDYCKDLEILIMKEYGVKESWTSLFIIRNLEICHYYGLAKPLFMTKTGKIVLLLWSNGAKVVAYNPKYDSIRDFLVPSERESINAITYVESLISPKEYYWNNYIHK